MLHRKSAYIPHNFIIWWLLNNMDSKGKGVYVSSNQDVGIKPD